MLSKPLLWILSIAFWLVFSWWYTDFGGPLKRQEINEGLALLQARGSDPERLKVLEAFFRADTGRQFLMVNNIDMKATEKATEDLNRYMEHLYPQLLIRACHPIFYGSGLNGFAADVSGIENATGWDTAALFRYRSRRSFLEIITHPEIKERHEYKLAAMVKTIAYPVEAQLYLSDPRLLLFLLLGFITCILDKLFYRKKKPGQSFMQPRRL